MVEVKKNFLYEDRRFMTPSGIPINYIQAGEPQNRLVYYDQYRIGVGFEWDHQDFFYKYGGIEVEMKFWEPYRPNYCLTAGSTIANAFCLYPHGDSLNLVTNKSAGSAALDNLTTVTNVPSQSVYVVRMKTWATDFYEWPPEDPDASLWYSGSTYASLEVLDENLNRIGIASSSFDFQYNHSSPGSELEIFCNLGWEAVGRKWSACEGTKVYYYTVWGGTNREHLLADWRAYLGPDGRPCMKNLVEGRYQYNTGGHGAPEFLYG